MTAHLVGVTRQSAGVVSVVAGRDPVDQRLTLLHELAHWLAPGPAAVDVARATTTRPSNHRLRALPPPRRAGCRRLGRRVRPLSKLPVPRAAARGSRRGSRAGASGAALRDRARRRPPMRVMVPGTPSASSATAAGPDAPSAVSGWWVPPAAPPPPPGTPRAAGSPESLLKLGFRRARLTKEGRQRRAGGRAVAELQGRAHRPPPPSHWGAGRSGSSGPKPGNGLRGAIASAHGPR